MKIYLTGGTGFVGSNIIRVARERYDADVLTTVNTWKPDGQVPFRYEQVDVCNRDAVLQSVEAFRPDAIIHAAALVDMAQIYENRERAWQIYVESTRHIIEAANRTGAKIILVSSDWVFDGTQGPAAEYDPPNPVNLYGVMKLVGETLIAESANDGAVARVAGANGEHWTRPNTNQRQNVGLGHLVPAILAELRRNRSFRVWEGQINMVGTPSLATECAEIMLRIITKDQQGIFHCCGGEHATRLEVAMATAEVFELDPNLVSTGPPDDDALAMLESMRIPRDTRLSIERTAELLGYQPPSLHEWLRRYRDQEESNV